MKMYILYIYTQDTVSSFGNNVSYMSDRFDRFCDSCLQHNRSEVSTLYALH